MGVPLRDGTLSVTWSHPPQNPSAYTQGAYSGGYLRDACSSSNCNSDSTSCERPVSAKDLIRRYTFPGSMSSSSSAAESAAEAAAGKQPRRATACCFLSSEGVGISAAPSTCAGEPFSPRSRPKAATKANSSNSSSHRLSTVSTPSGDSSSSSGSMPLSPYPPRPHSAEVQEGAAAQLQHEKQTESAEREEPWRSREHLQATDKENGATFGSKTAQDTQRFFQEEHQRLHGEEHQPLQHGQERHDEKREACGTEESRTAVVKSEEVELESTESNPAAAAECTIVSSIGPSIRSVSPYSNSADSTPASLSSRAVDGECRTAAASPDVCMPLVTAAAAAAASETAVFLLESEYSAVRQAQSRASKPGGGKLKELTGKNGDETCLLLQPSLQQKQHEESESACLQLSRLCEEAAAAAFSAAEEQQLLLNFEMALANRTPRLSAAESRDVAAEASLTPAEAASAAAETRLGKHHSSSSSCSSSAPAAAAAAAEADAAAAPHRAQEELLQREKESLSVIQRQQLQQLIEEEEHLVLLAKQKEAILAELQAESSSHKGTTGKEPQEELSSRRSSENLSNTWRQLALRIADFRRADTASAAPTLAAAALQQQQPLACREALDTSVLTLSAAAFFSLSSALQQPQPQQQQPQDGVVAALQRVAVSKQTLDDSLLLLRAAVAANPKDAGALMALAAVALHCRHYREAEEKFCLLLQLLEPLLLRLSRNFPTPREDTPPTEPMLLRPPHLLPPTLLCGEDAAALFACFKEAQDAGPIVLWPAVAGVEAAAGNSGAARAHSAASRLQRTHADRAAAVAVSLEWFCCKSLGRLALAFAPSPAAARMPLQRALAAAAGAAQTEAADDSLWALYAHMLLKQQQEAAAALALQLAVAAAGYRASTSSSSNNNTKSGNSSSESGIARLGRLLRTAADPREAVLAALEAAAANAAPTHTPAATRNNATAAASAAAANSVRCQILTSAALNEVIATPLLYPVPASGCGPCSNDASLLARWQQMQVEVFTCHAQRLLKGEAETAFESPAAPLTTAQKSVLALLEDAERLCDKLLLRRHLPPRILAGALSEKSLVHLLRGSLTKRRSNGKEEALKFARAAVRLATDMQSQTRLGLVLLCCGCNAEALSVLLAALQRRRAAYTPELSGCAAAYLAIAAAREQSRCCSRLQQTSPADMRAADRLQRLHSVALQFARLHLPHLRKFLRHDCSHRDGRELLGLGYLPLVQPLATELCSLLQQQQASGGTCGPSESATNSCSAKDLAAAVAQAGEAAKAALEAASASAKAKKPEAPAAAATDAAAAAAAAATQRILQIPKKEAAGAAAYFSAAPKAVPKQPQLQQLQQHDQQQLQHLKLSLEGARTRQRIKSPQRLLPVLNAPLQMPSTSESPGSSPCEGSTKGVAAAKAILNTAASAPKVAATTGSTAALHPVQASQPPSDMALLHAKPPVQPRQQHRMNLAASAEPGTASSERLPQQGDLANIPPTQRLPGSCQESCRMQGEERHWRQQQQPRSLAMEAFRLAATASSASPSAAAAAAFKPSRAETSSLSTAQTASTTEAAARTCTTGAASEELFVGDVAFPRDPGFTVAQQQPLPLFPISHDACRVFQEQRRLQSHYPQKERHEDTSFYSYALPTASSSSSTSNTPGFLLQGGGAQQTPATEHTAEYSNACGKTAECSAAAPDYARASCSGFNQQQQQQQQQFLMQRMLQQQHHRHYHQRVLYQSSVASATPFMPPKGAVVSASRAAETRYAAIPAAAPLGGVVAGHGGGRRAATLLPVLVPVPCASTAAAAGSTEREILQRLLGELQTLPPLFPQEKLRYLYEIGRGGFSRVWVAELMLHQRSAGSLATATSTGSPLWISVALKCMRVSPFQQPEAPSAAAAAASTGGEETVSLQELQQEVQQLQSLNHPSIVKLLGVSLLSWGGNSRGQSCIKQQCATRYADTEQRYYRVALVMELCSGGSLYALLHERRVSMTSKDRLFIAVQFVSALCYLHSRRVPIVHRDIKSLNIVLDGAGNAKLCDFGLAAEADMHTSTMGNTSRSLTASMRPIRPKEPLQPAGSPRYMPPELAAGVATHLDPSLDIWSAACVLLELFGGPLPYHRCHTFEEIQRQHAERVLPSFPSNLPKQLELLLRSCLAFEPSQRPSATLALVVQFMAAAVEFLCCAASGAVRTEIAIILELRSFVLAMLALYLLTNAKVCFDVIKWAVSTLTDATTSPPPDLENTFHLANFHI
ncbi:uncharacterized protein LOC34621273 [Cyclospora cayetanensis]|uniref:Uncharacterized protein LOC34621273 n=1 Tax=Cyclospora cayetanensis TaxID=88456 RepID=A0A6P6RTU1_9EIME|nr:uncharacterized protein LOC34621273 [Cyclospora cayetanensis]